MNVFNIYVYENRSMSNDLSMPLMLENLNVDNAQIHIPKEIDGTDMGTWAWWLVYQNAKREKYSIPMTLEGVTNDEGEEEYISTVSLNHGFTGKHGTVMYAIEAVQADGSGAATHEWHTRTYKLEIVHTLQGNQTEYSETESDIISALISRVNELITSGAEIAEIAATIEAAAETAQGVIDSIPSDYSALNTQVRTNTTDIATLKAESGDLTELETETKTDLVSAINEAVQSGLSDTVKQALLACFDHVAWEDDNGQNYYDDLESALYPQGDLEVISISATYTQTGNVYSDQPLTDLANDLVVTATYSDETTKVIEPSDYTLSGTLNSGTSTITVTYGGKTTTFNVNVTAWDPYNYSISNGQIAKVTGSTIVLSNRKNDIQLDSSDSTRRSFPTTRGVVRPFLDRQNGLAPLGYYPIPIPDDAIGAVVTVTPATQYHGVAVYAYTDSGGYVKFDGPDWMQGSHDYVFANLSTEDIKFITIAGKYNSSGGAYSEEPSELTVEFYKE